MRLPRWRPAEVALIAGAGVAALLAVLMVGESLIDDAYITLDYARNLALHLHWGLIPHEVANTATSPLNVVLLAIADELTRPFGHGVDGVAGVGIVTVAAALVMAWSWTRIARALELPLVAAAVAIALVVANPFLLSALGLEGIVVVAVLLVLLAVALEERPGWFGAVAGLALLTRLDLIVFVLIIGVATPAIRRGWARAALALALVAGPWLLFSWVYFGSAVPDTLVIKASPGQRRGWRQWDFFNGPGMYADIARRPGTVAVTFAPAVLGLLALLRWRALPRAAVGLALGGVAYYLVLARLNPGPYHWYYVVPVAALSAFGVIAFATLLRRLPERGVRRAGVPALGLGALAALAVAAAIGDVAHGVPWRTPIITTNFAVAQDYARVGRELRYRVGRANVASFGEIGTLAYYCECEIVDEYSHRYYVLGLVLDRTDRGRPLLRPLWDLNYAWFDRDIKEPRLGFRLAYRRGAGGRDVWNVWSPWNGLGRIRLIPAAPPP